MELGTAQKGVWGLGGLRSQRGEGKEEQDIWSKCSAGPWHDAFIGDVQVLTPAFWGTEIIQGFFRLSM